MPSWLIETAMEMLYCSLVVLTGYVIYAMVRNALGKVD